MGEVKELLPIPVLRKPVHRFDKEHYWEILKANYSLGKITSNIGIAVFIIERTLRLWTPLRRFVVLRKR